MGTISLFVVPKGAIFLDWIPERGTFYVSDLFAFNFLLLKTISYVQLCDVCMSQVKKSEQARIKDLGVILLGLLNISLLWHVNAPGATDISSYGECVVKKVRPARPQPF